MAGVLGDDLRGLLSGPNFAHLATLGPDGAPVSVPVWVDLQGDDILIFTQAGSRKARNIAREPRVALSVIDRANPYHHGDLRARVTGRREGAEGLAVADRLAHKYVGRPFPLRGPETIAFVLRTETGRSLTLPFGP